MKRTKETLSVLFLDVKGYSKLAGDAQFAIFFEAVLPLMAAKLQPHAPIYVNSWGDALVAAFRQPIAAARASLDLRDLFRDTDWTRLGLTQDLAGRIGLHAGSVFVGEDPLQKRIGLAGHNVNLAARIEPIAQPNEVWVSEAVAALLREEGDSKIALDDLGERPLAKQWGSRRLCRLRRHHEPSDLRISDVETVESGSQASVSSPYGPQSIGREAMIQTGRRLIGNVKIEAVMFGGDMSWANDYEEAIKSAINNGKRVQALYPRSDAAKVRRNAQILMEAGAELLPTTIDSGLRALLVDPQDPKDALLYVATRSLRRGAVPVQVGDRGSEGTYEYVAQIYTMERDWVIIQAAKKIHEVLVSAAQKA